MGGGAFNYGQTNQSGRARSGLAGSDYERQGHSNAVEAGGELNRVAGNASADMTRYNGQTGAQLLPGGQYGLGSNADPAVQQYGKFMFGSASGQGGARGQLSPENLGAVTGSAITNSLPNLIPQIQNWQLAQFNAPQQLHQGGVDAASKRAQYWASLLGAQSESNADSFNFGISGQGGPGGSPKG